MSHLSVGQIIMDAQRMVSRVKDLDSLSSALLVEAESNNRLVESLRHFQDDMDSLNRISSNKTNAEMVNRIQQQNAHSSEILKENRELKICIEDYERAMELMMQKYRENVTGKVIENKTNFKDFYNDRLWRIIREQREKINEMAAVMHRAASVDDDALNEQLETLSSLRLENKTLRELLQISTRFGTANQPIRFNELLLEEKAVQTEADDSADELSISGASVENAHNVTVIYNGNSNGNNNNSASLNSTADTADSASDNEKTKDASLTTANENNNGPSLEVDLIETPNKCSSNSTTGSSTILSSPNVKTEQNNIEPSKQQQQQDQQKHINNNASPDTSSTKSSSMATSQSVDLSNVVGTAAQTVPAIKGASGLCNEVAKAVVNSAT